LARWPATDHVWSLRRARAPAERLAALSAAALFTWSAAASAGELLPTLRFARHAQPVAALELSALQELAEPADVRVHEPYEARDTSFRAIPLRAVLDAVYSPTWRTEEEVLFTCRDGYQPGVPVERVLEHNAWLAFARVDGGDFTIDKLESGARKEVVLSPFYLIWENLVDEQVRADGDYGWPYQLVAVDLIRTRDRFPNMLPPPSATEHSLAGFRAFRMHCRRCHRINGEGGTIGQELVAPISPLDYRTNEWLRVWIDDPTQAVATARMPRLNPKLEHRQQTIDDILSYLGAMTLARDAKVGAHPVD
jgi:hypothetical protein